VTRIISVFFFLAGSSRDTDRTLIKEIPQKMFKRPPIPERFSSRRKTLLERKERHRTVSQSSKISTNSTVSEFLEAKVKDLRSEIDYLNDYRNGLLELDSTATPADPEFATTVTSAMKRLREREDELLVIKRQRKTLIDDVNEALDDCDLVEAAYANIIVNKVMLAGRQNKRGFNRKKFSEKVDNYYKAAKIEHGERYRWCHILAQWIPHKDVRAAHIVPKSLESEELNYFFGVGDVILSAPQNGKKL
jgi:hypothetical protein